MTEPHILSLFDDEEDGFEMSPQAEQALMDHIANMGFGTIGDPAANRRASIRMVNLHNFTINESEYQHFRAKSQFKHLDDDVLEDIQGLLMQESAGHGVKIALIDVNGGFVQAMKTALRNDPDFIIAGVCDDTTLNDDEILKYLQLAAETGHFCYLVHAPTSRLKGKFYSHIN